MMIAAAKAARATIMEVAFHRFRAPGRFRHGNPRRVAYLDPHLAGEGLCGDGFLHVRRPYRSLARLRICGKSAARAKNDYLRGQAWRLAVRRRPLHASCHARPRQPRPFGLVTERIPRPRPNTGVVRRRVRADRTASSRDRPRFTGRSEFQQVAVIGTPVFGKMLVLDGDTQSSQGDERIYHETLVHPALAGAAERLRRADSRRRRGRDAARGAALARRPPLHDGRHRRLGRRPFEEVSCPSGRTARSTIRARASSSATRSRSCATTADRYGVVISDLTEPLRGFAEQHPLQRRRLQAHQGAAGRWRRLRAPSQHGRVSQRVAALQDGTHAAAALPARRFVLHARARVRYRLGVSGVQRSRRSRRARARAIDAYCAQLRGENFFYDSVTHRRLFSLPLYLRRMLAAAGDTF